MLPRLRHSIATRLEVVWEYVWFLVCLSGASLSAAFGRTLIALLLAALTLGLGRRLVARQKHAARLAPKVPAWVKVGSLGLSMVESALLLRATDIPTWIQQEGHAPVRWALVVVALVAAYLIQVRVLAALSRRLFAN